MTDKKLSIEVESTQTGSGIKDTAQDVQKLEKQFDKAQQAANEFEREVNDVGEAVEDLRNNQETLTEAIFKAEIAFEKAQSASISLRSTYKQLLKSGEGTEAQFRDLSQQITISQERELEAINTTRSLIKQYARLNNETGDVAQEHEELARKLQSAEGWINGVDNKTVMLDKNMNKLGGSVDRVGDEVQEMGDKIDRGTKEIDRLGDRTEKAADKASKMSAIYTKGLDLLQDGLRMAAQAAWDFAQDSNRAFSEFDAGARQVFSLVPNMSQEMKRQLSRDALQIGNDLGRLPEETLPALYQALSLGIPEDNILEAVKVASDAARAGSAELEQTLITGQSIVNAYGSDVYELSDVYDILFTVVKNGAVTFGDLNAGMSAITSVAGEAHVSLEDIGAAIVTMTKQGDSFAEVSSVLSNVLGQLAIEGSTAGAAFKEIAGISFVEFMDQGHSLADALELLDTAAQESGQSLLNMVGGSSPFFRDIQAARGLVELTGRHLEEFKDVSELTYDAAGNTAEALGEVAGSMEIAEQKADAATESLKVQIGEALEPGRRKWLELKTAVAEAAAELAKQTVETRIYAESATEIQEQGSSIVETFIAIGEASTGLSEARFGIEDAAAGTTEALDTINAAFDPWNGSLEEMEMNNLAVAQATEILNQGFEGTGKELAELAIQQVQQAQAAEEQAAAQAELIASTAESRKQAFLFNDAMQAIEQQAGATTGSILNITEVLDGDTLKFETVEGEIQTLRFRNINTAEIDHGDGAMPFGDDALAFTQKWVDEHPIEIGAELDRESYGRIIAAVPELEEELVRQGLAIPMPATLSEDPEAAARFQDIVMEAAAAGRGMFEDEALAARILSGELVDLGQYYEEMAADQEALRAAYQSSIGPVDELMAAQAALAEAQGAEAEAAEERVVAAQDAIQASYQETALAAMEAALAGQAGGFEQFLALQVELGNITQQAADSRLEMANMTLAAEELGGSQEFLALTTEQQATAMDLLTGSYVASAEQAIFLASQYNSHLNPELIIAAQESDELNNQFNRMLGEAASAGIQAELTAGNIGDLSEKADEASGEMSGLSANISGVGSAAGGASGQVAGLRGEIDGLHSKTVTITLETKRVGGQGLEQFLNEPNATHAIGTGGWVTVPSGYPDDSYLVGLTSGESYYVDPTGQAAEPTPAPVTEAVAGAPTAVTNNSPSLTIEVQVSGYSDEVAEQIGADTKDKVLEAAESIGFAL